MKKFHVVYNNGIFFKLKIKISKFYFILWILDPKYLYCHYVYFNKNYVA